MEFFEKYTSNTLAGSGNQLVFYPDDSNALYTGRVFYRIFEGGEYDYSILFSNIIDSTYSTGEITGCNYVVDSWYIYSARVGITHFCNEKEFFEPDYFKTLTFDGKTNKKVAPGEFFCCDPVCLRVEKGEYICLEVTFKGRQLPYHEESIIPSFVLKEGKWIPSKKHIFGAMIGCNRKVKKKIAYLGDSITQGIGVPNNSYEHWTAVASEIFGSEFSYWNLGMGFGRAADIATDGAWLYKAKQNDIVFLCIGVNDIKRVGCAEQLKKNIERIMDILHKNGIKVVLQTIPPFNYEGKCIDVWNDVNDYIRNTLSKKADCFFDCVPILGKSDAEPYLATYGGHPNSAGSRLWGEAIAKQVKDFLYSV